MWSGPPRWRRLLCYRCITVSRSRAGFLRPASNALDRLKSGTYRTQRMPQQPELRSPPLTASPAPAPGSGDGPISGSGPSVVPGLSPVRLSGVEIGPDAGPVIIPVNPISRGLSGYQEAGQKPGPERIPPWLERSELFLRVLLRSYIGLVVCYLPWSAKLPMFQPLSREFWDQNPLFLQFPVLSVLAANGAVRGIVTGIGLLNLWIAWHDALRDRDGR